MVSSTACIWRIKSAVPSFQFLRTNLSPSLSKSVGATKKNLARGQRSLGKEMLRFLVLPCLSTTSTTFVFIIRTTSASCSAVAIMPFSFSTLSKAGHQSVSGRCRRYWRLNHSAFMKSNLAPFFEHLEMSNRPTISSSVISSWSFPGLHPSRARKLMTASGKYPCSR